MISFSKILMTLLVLATTAGIVTAQDGSTVSGRVIGITVDDLTHRRGTSKAERRYAVRVQLDSVKNTVLGLGEAGKSLVEEKSMFDLLVAAMENDWKVTLRLRREVSGSGSQRAHARIVAVTAQR